MDHGIPGQTMSVKKNRKEKQSQRNCFPQLVLKQTETENAISFCNG